MNEFDVFFSYNSKERPAVQVLANRLQHEKGLNVWLDKSQLRPGSDWQKMLEDAIKTTPVAVVLVGASGIGPWQDREIRSCLDEFVERGARVIPVLLPNCPKKPPLPPFLKQFTWVDLREDTNDAGFHTLIWGIIGEKSEALQEHLKQPESVPDNTQTGKLRVWLLGIMLAAVFITFSWSRIAPYLINTHTVIENPTPRPSLAGEGLKSPPEPASQRLKPDSLGYAESSRQIERSNWWQGRRAANAEELAWLKTTQSLAEQGVPQAQFMAALSQCFAMQAGGKFSELTERSAAMCGPLLSAALQQGADWQAQGNAAGWSLMLADVWDVLNNTVYSPTPPPGSTGLAQTLAAGLTAAAPSSDDLAYALADIQACRLNPPQPDAARLTLQALIERHPASTQAKQAAGHLPGLERFCSR